MISIATGATVYTESKSWNSSIITSRVFIGSNTFSLSWTNEIVNSRSWTLGDHDSIPWEIKNN